MKKKLIIFSVVIILIFSMANPTVLGASKGPTVAELQKKVAQLTKQVKTLSTSLVQKNKENAALKKEKDSLLTQIKSKDTAIKSKHNEITHLNTVVEEKNDLIEEQNRKIKDFERLSSAELMFTDKELNAGNDVKWYKFNTQQAIIYLTPAAYEKFGYVVDISDEVLEDIGEYFDSGKLSEKVSAFIWYGSEVTKTTMGEYKSNENRVLINGINFYPYIGYGHFMNLYVHEFTHAFQDIELKLFNGSNFPLFSITEGMGEYVDHEIIDYTKYNIPEAQMPLSINNDIESHKSKIINSVINNKINLQEFKTLPTKMLRDYAIYESLVYYIEKHYGKDKFLNFTKEAIKSQNIDDVFKSNFGVNEEQFINNWKKYYSL